MWTTEPDLLLKPVTFQPLPFRHLQSGPGVSMLEISASEKQFPPWGCSFPSVLSRRIKAYSEKGRPLIMRELHFGASCCASGFFGLNPPATRGYISYILQDVPRLLSASLSRR